MVSVALFAMFPNPTIGSGCLRRYGYLLPLFLVLSVISEAIIYLRTRLHLVRTAAPESLHAFLYLKAVNEFGGIDILVSNAAANPAFGRMLDVRIPYFAI